MDLTNIHSKYVFLLVSLPSSSSRRPLLQHVVVHVDGPAVSDCIAKSVLHHLDKKKSLFIVFIFIVGIVQ